MKVFGDVKYLLNQMSAIDWDGNLTHSNFNKPKIAAKRANKMAKSAKKYQFDDDEGGLEVPDSKLSLSQNLIESPLGESIQI